MLAPIAVEENGALRVWTTRADAGPARCPVAPPRLIDHPRARAGRDRAGGSGRAVVHHDHLVDHLARHAPQKTPDGVGFVEGRDDQRRLHWCHLQAGPSTAVHALPVFKSSRAAAGAHSSATLSPRTSGQYGSASSTLPASSRLPDQPPWPVQTNGQLRHTSGTWRTRANWGEASTPSAPSAGRSSRRRSDLRQYTHGMISPFGVMRTVWRPHPDPFLNGSPSIALRIGSVVLTSLGGASSRWKPSP